MKNSALFVVERQGAGQLPLFVGLLEPDLAVLVILRVGAVQLAAGVAAANLFLAAFVVARIGAVLPALLVGSVLLLNVSVFVHRGHGLRTYRSHDKQHEGD